MVAVVHWSVMGQRAPSLILVFDFACGIRGRGADTVRYGGWTSHACGLDSAWTQLCK